MSVVYNSGTIEVLLRGKPTTDPNVKKKVEDAIDESGKSPGEMYQLKFRKVFSIGGLTP